MFSFKLPDIGEGIQEGEIVRWIKNEGDAVDEDEPFVEVMTDKATVELTSPRKGKIAKLYFKEGDVAEVGQVLADIAEEGGSAPAAPAPAAEPAKAAPEAEEESTLFELPKEGAAATKTLKKGPSQAAPVASAVPDGYKATAAPAIRKFAREKGIDIHQVLGTGPSGRVTRDDVEGYLAGGPTTAAAPAAGAPTGGHAFDYSDVKYSTDADREERIPVRGLRKVIAKAMTRSKYTATHFTYVAEVDCDKLVETRNAAKGVALERGTKLTFLPFIAKAAIAALKQHPEVNAVFDEINGEVIRKSYYHLGIATATDQGLIVPVVKDADKKSMLAIADEIADLSERTRNMKAKADELSGSTFTITSLGKIGGVLATPVINYPELAIMGIHELKQVPVVKNGELAIGWRMNLSFSFDHRIIDGYNGALFANTLIKYLEDPQLLLLDS